MTDGRPAPPVDPYLVGSYWDTVQFKLEDRLVVHVSETAIGSGLTGFDTGGRLRCHRAPADQFDPCGDAQPDGEDPGAGDPAGGATELGEAEGS